MQDKRKQQLEEAIELHRLACNELGRAERQYKDGSPRDPRCSDDFDPDLIARMERGAFHASEVITLLLLAASSYRHGLAAPDFSTASESINMAVQHIGEAIGSNLNLAQIMQQLQKEIAQ